jgi:hypothetical protein
MESVRAPNSRAELLIALKDPMKLIEAMAPQFAEWHVTEQTRRAIRNAEGTGSIKRG